MGRSSHVAGFAAVMELTSRGENLREGSSKVEIHAVVWQDEDLPFTLAHPAAVLPLRRTRLVFSALVIGSMMPDVPYFLTLADSIRWGHSLAGAFWFCLPAGMALLWLFHSVVKRPLVALAPEFLRNRISEKNLEFRFVPANTFLLITVSLLIGIFSHILWDGFTHDHGYFVKIWPWLSEPVQLHRKLPLFKALQFVCSGIGVGLVGVVMVQHWRHAPMMNEPIRSPFSPKTRWLAILSMILLACAAGTTIELHRHHGHGWKWTTVQIVIATISMLGAELLLFSLAWQFRHRKKQKPPDREIQRLKVTAEH